MSTLQRTVRALEQKVSQLQAELTSTQVALAESSQEHESYKVTQAFRLVWEEPGGSMRGPSS